MQPRMAQGHDECMSDEVVMSMEQGEAMDTRGGIAMQDAINLMHARANYLCVSTLRDVDGPGDGHAPQPGVAGTSRTPLGVVPLGRATSSPAGQSTGS